MVCKKMLLNWVFMMIAMVFDVGAWHHPHHNRARIEQVIYETDNAANSRPAATECNASGVWYNALGSELILEVSENGQITGEFRTGVERIRGAAGDGPGVVTGWASHDGSKKALGFSVLWNNGSSVTSWSGLCDVCDGVEVLKTMWVLTSEVETCDEHWAMNRVGQDEFIRDDHVPGPRKHLDTHTPMDVLRVAQAEESEETGGLLGGILGQLGL